MKHEKHYTCWIERKWHIPLKSPSPRLATGFLVSNAWIQLKLVLYWWWFCRQWCRDVASGADRHLDITFGLQVVESSSLVSVLFREVFSHPYISFFHLLVKGFSVIIIIIIINFFRVFFSECTEAIATSLIPLVTNFPEICDFIIGFSFTEWTKMRPLLAH